MAKGRSAANLAGLAALGALGYKLYGGGKGSTSGVPVEDRVGVPVEKISGGQASFADGDADIGMGINESGDVYYPYGAIPAPRAAAAKVGGGAAARAAAPAAAAAAAPTPALSAAASDEMMRSRSTNRAPVPAVIGPRSTGVGGYTAAELAAYQRQKEMEPMRGRGFNRASGPDEMMRGRGANRADATTRQATSGRPLTREEAIAAIPRDKNKVVGGERVKGNEFTRNLSNTLNATAGLSAPGFVGNMTQKQYNARAAARRSEEGMSSSEAAEFRRRMADAAADGGMKRGGAVKAKVKKMASGGSVSSASKRADGIASRGKTKCKMY